MDNNKKEIDLTDYEKFMLPRFGNEDTYENHVISPHGCVVLTAALGLAGESGEVVDIIKKAYFHNKELDKDHLLEEMGDVFCYLVALADKFGFTLQDIMDNNKNKLSKRYPDGFNFKDANADRNNENKLSESKEEINDPFVTLSGFGYIPHPDQIDL